MTPDQIRRSWDDGDTPRWPDVGHEPAIVEWDDLIDPVLVREGIDS